MHEPSTAAYPRPGGVLIPAILVRAGYVAAADGSAAVETVKWVRAALRHLPAELLDTTLPDPGLVLRSWSLGARTRGALARLGTCGAAKEWRVRDLIGASRLGPAALVDLLAAREENVRRASQAPLLPTNATTDPEPLSPSRRSAPLASRLDGLSATIRRRLPLRPEELGSLVRASGMAEIEPSVDEVARLFRDWEVPVPFRAVRRGGASILVAPSSLAAAEALLATASHLVFHWGLATLSTVVGGMRSSMGAKISLNAAARVLATLPRFRWLDEAAGWFSFGGYNSRVRGSIRKVFSVTDRVLLSDLILAVGKRVKALSIATRPAIEAYLADVAGCEVSGDWVRPGVSFVAEPLSGCERAIVEVLRLHGGIATREVLRREAVGAGVRPAAIRHFLRTSPLVIGRLGKVGLVGSPRIAALAPKTKTPPGRRANAVPAEAARLAVSFG